MRKIAFKKPRKIIIKMTAQVVPKGLPLGEQAGVYFPLGFGRRWARSEAATSFSLGVLFGSRKILLASEAGFLPVAITKPHAERPTLYRLDPGSFKLKCKEPKPTTPALAAERRQVLPLIPAL
jgi:hypothetical protein